MSRIKSKPPALKKIVPTQSHVTVKKHKNVCHFDLDQMTLILKLDLDIMMTFLHTKIEVSR